MPAPAHLRLVESEQPSTWSEDDLKALARDNRRAAVELLGWLELQLDEALDELLVHHLDAGHERVVGVALAPALGGGDGALEVVVEVEQALDEPGLGGHQLALNMAAGLGLGGSESYPGVFQPYGGFADDIPVVDGYTTLHDTPGIGVELKRAMFSEMRKLLGYS